MSIINKDNAECILKTIKEKGDIGIDDIMQCSGMEKGKVLAGLKIGTIVVLESDSLDGNWKYGKIYKEIYDKKIKGKTTMLTESYGHYSWGQYATVQWDNGHISDWIHTSYLKIDKLK